MSASNDAPTAAGRSPGTRLVRQLVGATVGALVGATLWYLLAVPAHLINVIFSVLVGLAAGLGAGRLSGSARSAVGTVLTVVVTAVVLLGAQVLITRTYLTWATGRLPGVPSHPSWDGPIGGLRLALDRAAGRNGWSRNASYFYWIVSLGLAASLSWFTAERPAARRSS